MDFQDLLKDYLPYRGAVKQLKDKRTPIAISGIVESAQPQLIYSMVNEAGCPAVIITYSDMEAKNLYKDIEFFTDRAVYFPGKEYIFYNIETTGHQNEHERLAVIDKIVTGVASIVVTSLDAVMDYTVPPELFEKNVLNFKTGERHDFDILTSQLVELGYTREDMVEGVGQFSIRGGILDIFPPSTENPVRIEFFDDEVDSIRSFDIYSQRTLENAEDVRIIPVSEAVISEKRRGQIVELLKKQIKGASDEKFIENMSADIESFNNRHTFPSIDKYVTLLYDRVPSILEYFDLDSAVFIIDPKRIFERAKSLEWEEGEKFSEFSNKAILPNGISVFRRDFGDIIGMAYKRRLITLDVLARSSTDIKPVHKADFTTKTTVSFHGKIEYLYDDLGQWRKKGYTAVILASNRGRGENLAGVLNDRGIPCRYLHDDRQFKQGETVILRGNLNKGFEYPDLKFVLVSDREIFESQRRKTRKKLENANRIKSYNDISIGDYVVHQNHGIGQYEGIKKMTVNGVTKDYLKIQYHGSDVLYVPIDQLDLLYKYVGDTDKVLKLNKLGGTDWSKAKQKVKASTAEMARQLVALYAEREKLKGFAFSKDTSWQREFEDSFGYTETEDQLRSIEEVKADMESEQPMDRLLCGDVGYGKTEVALRAAFKAINDSKQVAYLCPTTVLAMQHYNTFIKRMQAFPVKVEMLSRFRTAAQQKKIIKQLKTGEIDVIIGTHRILQKDIEFKDLGLLVVDEEQRFGVAHKERLKEIKKNVDVLTMTATPIPRTLHMAMISVRDMSVLSEPPENRYPVQTYVLEDNSSIIIDAIKNELSRGGQVYYLFNRVKGIYSKAAWLQSQIPDARIAVGHGKMKEGELEDIMYDMVNGSTDILVCTTIIETGLDIPNANTIIIENADKMGLAQLYQLRGRVGRSNRAAYAYLTYRKDSILSDIAQKRLQAVKEFTEFGSGFKIAMRDLEIRGAGNILGPEQHGHMDAVGYDMYCKILNESVREAQGLPVEEDITVSVDLNVDAYLPDRYIPNHNQRIDMYKRIAAIESEDDKFEIQDELIDRYGDIPKAAANIIEIAYLKVRAKALGIIDMTQTGERLILKFIPGKIDAEIVMGLEKKFPGCVKIVTSENPAVNILMPRNKKPLEGTNIIITALEKINNH